MDSDEGEWEVVNTKQKKSNKSKQRSDKNSAESLARQREEDLEEQRKLKEKEKFLTQYAELSANTDLLTMTGGSLFGAFADYEDKKKKKKEAEIKKMKSKKIVSNGVFEGEEVIFQDGKDKKKSQQKTKAKSSNQPQTKREQKSLESVSSSLDANTIKNQLSEFTARNPQNYDVQLKNLAEYMEEVFNASDADKATIQRHYSNQDQPLALIPNAVANTIKGWLNNVPEQHLVDFVGFLIHTLLMLTVPGTPNPPASIPRVDTKGIGLQLLLALIARSRPQTLVKSVPLIREFYAPKTLLPSTIPFFIWLFGQPLKGKSVSSESAGVALSLWFQFLLPLIFDTSKNSYQDSVYKHVEQIVEGNSSVTMDDASAVVAFERLIMYKMSVKQLPVRLQALLPKLSNRKFLFPENAVSKRFFKMLLGHAATEKEALRNQVLPALVDCLAEDESCYSFWQEIYPNYIANTSNLLLYITLNWQNQRLYDRLSADKLVGIAQFFTQNNKTLRQTEQKKSKPSNEELKEIEMCNVTSKSLKKALKPYQARAAQHRGGFVAMCTSVIPATLIMAGVAAYTLTNCCDLQWCRSNAFLADFVNCTSTI